MKKTNLISSLAFWALWENLSHCVTAPGSLAAAAVIGPAISHSILLDAPADCKVVFQQTSLTGDCRKRNRWMGSVAIDAADLSWLLRTCLLKKKIYNYLLTICILVLLYFCVHKCISNLQKIYNIFWTYVLPENVLVLKTPPTIKAKSYCLNKTLMFKLKNII